MYRVYVTYGGAEYPLYEPLDDEVRIFEPVLTEEIGSAGSFQFRIYKGHPFYEYIKPCRSEIILYRDDKALFYGRVLKPEQDFNNMVTIICEGELTYLLDSIQRPFTFSGNMSAYVGKLLEIHNSQVEAEKRVEKGNIIVAGDDADKVLNEYAPTLTVLRNIANVYGGYYKIRHDGGKRYLDYVWDYGGINGQTIRFGENLLDLTNHVDASQIITCLIPLGGEVEYKDDLGEMQTKTVDIKSVNGGKDYIENTKAVEKYGRIWSSRKFEEVIDPEKLLKKAEAHLEEAASLPETIEISAVDLSLIDLTVEEFCVGYWTNVSSSPHGIEQRFMLSKREINIQDPTESKIILGKKKETFTERANRVQVAMSARVEQVAKEAAEEIVRKVENATSLITGGLGGYVVLDNIDPTTGKKAHPWRILIMNTPDKDTARNIIQINQNGLGFSTTGINGPYRNAWTIDGNLVADFITSGTMFADRIRGGTLELGGTGPGRDGGIIVKDINGNTIGSWDKTGLSILRGLLQGVSAIFGGVNNQNGAVEVLDASGRRIGLWDKDGLIISRGVIDIGNGLFYVDQDVVQFGDWEVSADGSNVLRSLDGSVILKTEQGGPFGSYATLVLAKNGSETAITDHGIDTLQISSKNLECKEISEMYGWSSKWNDVAYSIDWCFIQIEKLREEIENLSGM